MKKVGSFSLSQSQRGFTIVELLIVIVIIGILAALVIVAYNGVQQRARNTQRVAAAKEYYKIIQGYLTLHGQYPAGLLPAQFPGGSGASGAYSGVCLGEGYPTDFDENPDQDCAHSANVKHPVTSVNTELRKIASLPDFPKQPIQHGSHRLLGIWVRATNNNNETVDGVLGYPNLRYWLEGHDQNCGFGQVLVLDSAPANYISSATATNTYNEGSGTACIIKLPNPNG